MIENNSKSIEDKLKITTNVLKIINNNCNSGDL